MAARSRGNAAHAAAAASPGAAAAQPEAQPAQGQATPALSGAAAPATAAASGTPGSQSAGATHQSTQQSVQKAPTKGPAKPQAARPSAGRLRAWGAAALVAATVTGASGLVATNMAGTDPSAVYQQDLTAAVQVAEQLPNAAQAARSAGTGSAQAQNFQEQYADLATRIPELATNAPEVDAGSYGTINRELNAYAIGTVTGSGTAANADQQYRSAVVTPLTDLSAKAANPSPLATGLYGTISFVSMLVMFAAAVVLARTTKRVLDIRVTGGLLLLGGSISIAFSTLVGDLVWPPGVIGALLLAGGVISGALAWSGMSKRAEEYR